MASSVVAGFGTETLQALPVFMAEGIPSITRLFWKARAILNILFQVGD